MTFALAATLGACATTADPDANPDANAMTSPADTTTRPAYALAIHGGAGVITRDQMTPEYEADVRAVLAKALDTGEAILAAGGTCEDAVVAVISVLEDDPHFNAGKGAVFTYEGTNELDASFMRGRDLNAGAVSGVTGIKNPIKLARHVLEDSEHVMLSGKGAEAFAADYKLETAPPSYFRTEARYESWQRARAESDGKPSLSENGKFGTVGCVAMDKEGHLAPGPRPGA